MKISLFLMVFIITTFLFSASATDYTINDNTVYINDDKVYLSAYPHTLNESGYVYFNLTSKQYSGNIDFFFGFNSLQCKPISSEIFIDGSWIDISHRFNSINYDYDNLNKWYYLKEIPIYSNINYTLRACLKINEISTGGKYGVAIKPSHETISQAINNNHFYYLDPWWNGSWLYRKTITLTGNTSGAQTDYQLLLNVTYDSDMQSDFDDLRFANDTYQIDAWLESKVDNEYALIWVEIPTTPANGVDQDYYMYYGNEGAASDWDEDATFLNFDGFEDGSTIDAGDIWVFGLNYASSAQAHSGTYSFDIPSTELISQSLGSYAVGSVAIGMWMYNVVTSGRQLTWSILDSDGNSGTDSALYLKFEGAKTYAYYSDAWHDLSLPFTTGWNYVEIISSATTSDVSVNGNTVLNVTNRNTVSNIDKIFIESVSGANFIDDNLVCKYVVNPPIYIFGDEEMSVYIPPDPTNLQNTTGDFWINHTWQPGTGNVSDSYNISVNGVWHNTTTNTYWNITYDYGNNSWQNITIWAYNNSGTGTLSINSISQNTLLYFTNFPTNLQKTHNHTWINWTWHESFIGTHIIDSYNVSINGTWYNSTTAQFYNHTCLDYGITSSIIVYGYNNTQGLSIYYVFGSHIFLTKYKIVEALKQLVTPIQTIADKFFNIIPFIISIILFAGFGLAIMVMTSRLKKW